MIKKYLLNLSALICSTIFFMGSSAAETTYKTHAALKSDFQNLDWNGGKVTVGSLKGVSKIYGSSDPIIPNGDSVQNCLIRVVKMGEGTEIMTNCVATDKDGDTLYSISERKQGDINAGGRGKTTYIGGTGKYKGASGGCEYTASYLPDNWLSVDSSCTIK